MTKQEIRRAVIREWMALPSNQRQTKEQTDSFALKAMHRRASAQPQRRVPRDDGLVAITDWQAVTMDLPRRRPIVARNDSIW
jgi:hypothetical protein